MRTIKDGNTFKEWFDKFNELIGTGVVGSFSADPDFHDGLDFYTRESVFRRGTVYINIPATFSLLANNSTNIVYLDTTDGSEEISSAVEGSEPSSNAVSLYRVTTVSGEIDQVEDLRTWLNTEIYDHKNLLSVNDPDAHPQYVLKIQNNLDATTDPDATNDETEGYEVLSLWLNKSTKEIWKCLDATEGAAVWGQTTLDIEDLGSAAVLDVGVNVDDIPKLEDVGGGTSGLPPVDGTQLTGILKESDLANNGGTIPENDVDEVITGNWNFTGTLRDDGQLVLNDSDLAANGGNVVTDDRENTFSENQKLEKSSGSAIWRITGYRDTDTSRAYYIGEGAKGTQSSPVALSDGDRIMSIGARPYNGSSFESPADLIARSQNSNTEIQWDFNTKAGVTVGDVSYQGPGSINAAEIYKNGVSVEVTTHDHDSEYLGINDKAADSDLLDGLNSTSFLRSNANDIKTSGYLRFNDSINLNFGSSNDVEFFCNGSHMYMDLNSGIGNFYIRNWSTTRFTFNDNGDFTASGNVTAYSDQRVKVNIEVIPDALDKVSELSGYTFERTDIKGERQTGIIAQELMDVLPEAVIGGPTEEDPDALYSVAYGNLVGLLVESIKELKTRVEELENK